MLSSPFFRSKKFVALILTAVVIVPFLLFLFLATRTFLNNREDAFGNQVRHFINQKSGDSQTPDELDDALDTATNTSLSPLVRYTGLGKLAFYFSGAYSSTHDPEIREFSSKVLADYAAKNFPDMYQPSLFKFVCADPSCGMRQDVEIDQIINALSGSSLSKEEINSIKQNLTTAGYIPASQIEEKQIGFNIVIGQLTQSGDPQASKAAVLLKDYAKKKYKMEL